MIIIKAPTPSMNSFTPPAIFKALEEEFRGDWRNRHLEVSRLIQSLKSDYNLLRWFITQAGRNDKWPTMTGAQSFTVHSSDALLARINLWFPAGEIVSESYRRYLSIDELHNHDFDFYTTCLHGNGYDSTFLRDPNFNEDRRVGEHIHLVDEIALKLEKDDVWFIEAGNDYHAQHWPSTFAVTLNVLPNWRERSTSIQYVLDGSHKIKTVIDSRLRPIAAAA